MNRALTAPIMAVVVHLSCAGPSRVDEGLLEVNGTSLFYRARGEGEPIVVLHGGPGFDHRQFLPYIWRLAEHHRVILYDQRGTGLSGGPVDAESISIGTFVDDVEAVRRAIGIERMNLVGHSWGGILAMHYGIRYPANLRSLVLCSTAASVDSFAEMRSTYEARRSPEDARLLEEIYASAAYRSGDPLAVERFWRVYLKPYFKDQALVDNLDLRFTPATIRNGTTVAGLMMRSLGTFDLHRELRAITCPTLVVHGDEDPMPVKYAERIRDSVDGAELVILDGSGHWPFVDATDSFTAAVERFLDRVEPGRGRRRASG